VVGALSNYGKAHGMQVHLKQAEKFSDLELINLLAVSLPFHPAEKQALLEARDLKDRETMLINLLNLGAGPVDPDSEAPSRTLN
jgi:Lon protease-like protein